MAYYNEQAMTTPGFYGSKPVDSNIFQTGGIGHGFFDSQENWGPAWAQFVGGFAGGNESKFANWLRQRQQRTGDEYTAQNAANPDLKFTDYVLGQQGNLQNEYAGMNPSERGGQTPQRGLRWL